MTTVVLVPMTLVVLLGEPVSLPCERELPSYRVTPSTGLVAAPVQPESERTRRVPSPEQRLWTDSQANAMSVDAVKLSYDVDARVLVVHPVKEGRIFCDGFERRVEL